MQFIDIQSSPIFTLGESSDEREFTNLWFLATLTYGVGDVVTTIALTQFSKRVAEANVLIRLLMDAFGSSGLVGLKLTVFLICIGVSIYSINVYRDRVLYYAPPVTLAFVGSFTTVYNLRLLFG